MPILKYDRRRCRNCKELRKHINPAWLKARRKAAGIPLRTLAQQLGTADQHLCDVEGGRRACSPRVLAAYEAIPEPSAPLEAERQIAAKAC